MTQSCNLSQNDDRKAERLRQLLEPGFFKALADPNRVALLLSLASLDRPCTVTEAAGCCPVDLSVVSRHLVTLRQAGILEAEKRGREVLYSVRYTELVTALRSLADAIESCCPPTGDSTTTSGCETPQPSIFQQGENS